VRARPALAIGGMLDGCSVHGLGTATITLHWIYGTRLTVEIGRHQTNVVFSVAAWLSTGSRFADLDPGPASIGCGVRWCGRMRDAEGVQGSSDSRPKPRFAEGVVFIAAEGGLGIEERLTAFRMHHDDLDVGDVPLHVIAEPVDLCRSADDVTILIQRCEALSPVALIVVDTLSRVMAGGNENSPDDCAPQSWHTRN
jgi:hypothetical protein